MGIFRQRTVADITGKFNSLVDELNDHAEASYERVAHHAKKEVEHRDHKARHLEEAAQAKRVAEKIKALVQ